MLHHACANRRRDTLHPFHRAQAASLVLDLFRRQFAGQTCSGLQAWQFCQRGELAGHRRKVLLDSAARYVSSCRCHIWQHCSCSRVAHSSGLLSLKSCCSARPNVMKTAMPIRNRKPAGRKSAIGHDPASIQCSAHGLLDQLHVHRTQPAEAPVRSSKAPVMATPMMPGNAPVVFVRPSKMPA